MDFTFKVKIWQSLGVWLSFWQDKTCFPCEIPQPIGIDDICGWYK